MLFIVDQGQYAGSWAISCTAGWHAGTFNDDMRRSKSLWVLGVCVVAAILVDGCKHGKCQGGGTSTHGSVHSHNEGENCMSCHHPDTEAPCWEIGGTAFHPGGVTTLPNATLLLFSGPLGQGTLLDSIDFDGLGNVYTSEAVQFGIGIFPAVLTPAGDTAFMNQSIRDGACNRCHGVTTERITAP